MKFDEAFPFGWSLAECERVYNFIGPEHAHRVLTGRMLVSYETIRLGMLADIERMGKTIAELQGRLTEKNARIAELETRVEELEESASMACITPADDCDCSGCLYAAERGGDA